MRHWSPWDEQLLRALRGEFKPHFPILIFERGLDGGVAVFSGSRQIGLWIATGQHQFRYLAGGREDGQSVSCDIMDIIPANYELFSELLDGRDRNQA